MHILHDENGNPVPHHGAEHCGGQEHHCGACAKSEHCDEKDRRKEVQALLQYMYQHNQQHAAELDRLAANLVKLGMSDVAKQVTEGVSEYQKGNIRLNLALSLLKSHLEEEA